MNQEKQFLLERDGLCFGVWYVPPIAFLYVVCADSVEI